MDDGTGTNGIAGRSYSARARPRATQKGDEGSPDSADS